MISLTSRKRYVANILSQGIETVMGRLPVEPGEVATILGIAYDCTLHESTMRTLILSAIHELEERNKIGYVRAARIIHFKQLGEHSTYIPCYPIESITTLKVWQQDGVERELVLDTDYRMSGVDARSFWVTGYHTYHAELRYIGGYAPEALPEYRRAELLMKISQLANAGNN